MFLFGAVEQIYHFPRFLDQLYHGPSRSDQNGIGSDGIWGEAWGSHLSGEGMNITFLHKSALTENQYIKLITTILIQLGLSPEVHLWSHFHI